MPFLVEPSKEGYCFIISAPAGTGKTTLVQMLVEEFPAVVANVSYTTRSPRIGEVDGKDYHFITRSNFETKIASGDFLEYVKLYDDYYGSSREWVLGQQKLGKHVVLVIDTQGALQLKGKIDAAYVFISPPSLEELKNRLSKRKTESPETLAKRIAQAIPEMKAIHHYDYMIVNDDLHKAYEVLKSIVIAETHRIRKAAHVVPTNNLD
jgi:guanylate kinase